jgi:hypothetical protein
MTPKFPKHSYVRYTTVKNSDTKTVENVWLWFDNGKGETGVQVSNVASKKEAWKKYYNEM